MCESVTGNEVGSTEDGSDADVGSTSAFTDLIFEILSDAERRHALHCLEVCQGPVALADLADSVARRKYDESLAEIAPEDVKRVYLRLYHSHVPKLEEADLVEYDQECDSVRTTPRFADVDLDEFL